jgi:hypothetical protein
MDFAQISAEWLRLIRGKRSQRGFSRRLGYSSNIAYRWESQVCFPTAAETFALVERSNQATRQRLVTFLGAHDELPARLGARPGVARNAWNGTCGSSRRAHSSSSAG